jgi:hypothetical protein
MELFEARFEVCGGEERMTITNRPVFVIVLLLA